jgi:hypothetical protein
MFPADKRKHTGVSMAMKGLAMKDTAKSDRAFKSAVGRAEVQKQSEGSKKVKGSGGDGGGMAASMTRACAALKRQHAGRDR